MEDYIDKFDEDARILKEFRKNANEYQKKADEYKTQLETVTNIAKDFKGQLLFVSIGNLYYFKISLSVR